MWAFSSSAGLPSASMRAWTTVLMSERHSQVVRRPGQADRLDSIRLTQAQHRRAQCEYFTHTQAWHLLHSYRTSRKLHNCSHLTVCLATLGRNSIVSTAPSATDKNNVEHTLLSRCDGQLVSTKFAAQIMMFLSLLRYLHD